MNDAKQILDDIQIDINEIERIVIDEKQSHEQCFAKLYHKLNDIFQKYKTQRVIEDFKITTNYHYFRIFFFFIIKLNIQGRSFTNKTCIWPDGYLN